MLVIPRSVHVSLFVALYEKEKGWRSTRGFSYEHVAALPREDGMQDFLDELRLPAVLRSFLMR